MLSARSFERHPFTRILQVISKCERAPTLDRWCSISWGVHRLVLNRRHLPNSPRRIHRAARLRMPSVWLRCGLVRQHPNPVLVRSPGTMPLMRATNPGSLPRIGSRHLFGICYVGIRVSPCSRSPGCFGGCRSHRRCGDVPHATPDVLARVFRRRALRARGVRFRPPSAGLVTGVEKRLGSS